MGHPYLSSFYWVCKSNLAFMKCRAMNSKRSKMEQTADTIPLRVIGLWFARCNIFSKNSHAKLSSSVFHLRPGVLSVGSHSSSRLTTDLALSDSGIAASTSVSLLYHFSMRKTPFSSSLRSWLAKLTTSSLALASFIMISTYILHFTVASTFASNLSWFNCAVFLRQKLATLGQDVAPNRCFTIRYSSISFVRSPFGHHKNTFIFKKCHNLLGPPGIGKTLLLCQQLLMVFVQTFLHDHHPHLAGLQGMRYWVVREVSHWSIRCVQLFFRHSFCMSSFYEVVHCRPIFPQQFFILHETPLQKQSTSLCLSCCWVCMVCRVARARQHESVRRLAAGSLP